MIDINKEKEIDFKKIYGIDKKTKKYLYDEWLEKYPILANKDTQSWLRDKIDEFTNEGKNASDFVIIAYLLPFQQYCDFNKVENPSLLLTEEIDIRNQRVKKYLMYLFNVDEKDPMLKEMGFKKKPSEVTVRNMIQSRVKSFYSNRGKPVSFGIDSRKSGANKDELFLDKEILKKIQAKLNTIEYRLICKYESQCGLRINDILEEVTNGKYAIEKHKEHYFIRNFQTQKEKVIINFLFFTNELSELLQSAYPIKDNDLTKLDLTKMFITRNDTRINSADYLRRLKDIIGELGIKGNIKTHGLRKYFISQIDKCNQIEDNFKRQLEGHMVDYRDQAYINHLKNIEWYYENWKKIEQLVCVDCVVYDNTTKEVLKLKEKNVALDEQVNILLKEKIKTEKRLDDLEKWKNELLKEFKSKK